MNTSNLLTYFLQLLNFNKPNISNNTCKNLEDYTTLDKNNNCYYNRDVYDTNLINIVRRHGYEIETHYVETEDGYLLTIFRLPKAYERRKGVVLLEHPVITSAALWVDKNEASLGFLLSNAGFDVWLGNFRGTTLYGRKHKRLSPENKRFWKFSFHEVGIYDVPSHVKYIGKFLRRNEKIIYIGYSMGSTAGLVYSSLLPYQAKKFIKNFVFLTPAAYFKNASLFTKLLLIFSDVYMAFAEIFTTLECAAKNGTLQKILSICNNPALIKICTETIQYINGRTKQGYNPIWLPIIYNQLISGTSVRILRHYKQLVDSDGLFRMYDYGKRGNFQLYNSEKPPIYPLRNILVPIHLIYGKKDEITTAEDSRLLLNNLPNNTQNSHVVFDDYDHFSFGYGKQLMQVYNHILRYLHNVV